VLGQLLDVIRRSPAVQHHALRTQLDGQVAHAPTGAVLDVSFQLNL
jgi:hypothetical protein